MSVKQSMSDSVLINGFSMVNSIDGENDLAVVVSKNNDFSALPNRYDNSYKKNFDVYIAKKNDSYQSIVKEKYGANGTDMRAIVNKLKALSIPQEDKYREIVLPQRISVNGTTYILKN